MNLAEILEALGSLAWPVLAAVLLWKLYPALNRVLGSRAFTVKIGDMEVSVQDASENLQNQIADLQEKVAALRARLGTDTQAPVAGHRGDLREALSRRHILWVDDKPENNAFEIARLQDEGYEVVTVTSTSEALNLLTRRRADFDMIISDMGRHESGRWVAKAGLQLLAAVRSDNLSIPFLVYTTAKRAAQDRSAVIAAGGSGTTGSALELLELVRDATQRQQA